MSSAEFVCNSDANTTVYRWEATGIDELTRQNKLTSLPFWVPNAQTRHHQFKLVLLRGLVPSADSAQDAVGLIVELIPPPPPAAEGSGTADGTVRNVPGGCAVTCEVLPVDVPATTTATSAAPQQQQQRSPHAKTLRSTKTAVVDGANAQVSFPDLIPADLLRSARYVSGTPKSLTLQITIETGISVPLHQVATTAYSFFSSLSSSVTQLLGSTTHLVHEGRENLSAILSHAANANGSAAGSQRATPRGTKDAAQVPPPWERPPEEWRSRPEAWRSLLVGRLAGLDGTYRHGVEKTLSTAEVALLSEVGLSEGDLWALYGLFDFDRDVQENLLTAATVRARRYALVPAKLREEVFWANYFWKAHCVGQCVTDRQVSAVIAVLCAPARAMDADASASAEEVLRVMADATELTAVLGDFMNRGEAGEAWCSVVAETARQCVAVLRVSSHRTDLAVHTQQQLSRAMADLEASLLRYGGALATPPSTPAVGAADVAAAADAVPPVAFTEVAAGADSPSPAIAAPQSAEAAAAPGATDALPDVAAAGEAEASGTPAVDSLEQEQRETSPPPSPTPPLPAEVAVPSSPGRAEAGRSGSRIEFAKMPWEEEDDA